MNELQAIIALAETTRTEKLQSNNVKSEESELKAPLAMATVVKVTGSAYRRPGARMLMTAAGEVTGMISGGCLESDVQERARKVMATGESRLVTYDSTSPEDIVFGLGLGCNGIVQIVIEPLRADAEDGLLAFLSACLAQRKTGNLLTVFHAEGVSPTIAPGTRLLQWPDGRVTSNSNDPVLIAALAEALTVNSDDYLFQQTDKQRGGEVRAAVKRIALESGSIELLLETITPPVSLLIFGAGNDVIPVTLFAKLLGWHVTVIDGRPAYALPERFPAADTVLCLRPESLADCPPQGLTPDAMAIIMTHSYVQDRELLQALLPVNLRYLGILGPKARTQRLLDELLHTGVLFSEECLARLYGPAGLDIGAETPEEIALSLLAEMRSVLGNRAGVSLRQRNRGIHDVQ